MGRGGVTTFDGLVDAVGDNSSVDGNAPAPVVAPRMGLSRSVPLRDLVENPYNPRDSLGDLEELASIVDYQLQPVVVVNRLLGEPSITGKRIAQRLLDRSIGFEIRLRNGIIMPLRSNFEPLAFPIATKDLTSLARSLLRELQLARQIIFFHRSSQRRKSYLHLDPDSIADWFALFAITNLRCVRGPTWR